MSGAWRSLVARVLWELPNIQTKSIANTDKQSNITFQIVRVSEDVIVARVLLSYPQFKTNTRYQDEQGYGLHKIQNYKNLLFYENY